MLDAGVRVTAVRGAGALATLDFMSRRPSKRSLIIANDRDVLATIHLGNPGEPLRDRWRLYTLTPAAGWGGF